MRKVKDGWTWEEMSFAQWRRAVNRRLLKIYGIDIEHSGVDDDFLMPHWEDKESPFEFVSWYGSKYDLDPK